MDGILCVGPCNSLEDIVSMWGLCETVELHDRTVHQTYVVSANLLILVADAERVDVAV
jgi:hypothetical protein